MMLTKHSFRRHLYFTSTSLNNVKIGSGKVGKVFSTLLSQWSKNQKVDIKKQIIDWDKENKKFHQTFSI